MYKAPSILSEAGITRRLRDLSGSVLVVTMDIPWSLTQAQTAWTPDHIHNVTDMSLGTLETLERTLPVTDIVIGIGGGSCCDTAKYLAWKRGCRMILIPTIISVDAPLTNMVGVRVNNAVKYVGDIYPEELWIDYDLIRQAPPELNRAGAADIASIHTALYDWKLAHEKTGEAYHADVANLAQGCLEELDRHAGEVHAVTPAGIDCIVDMYRREVEFCARIGTSRPEEGSEHLIAYNMEHLTRRHFVHGDLVALGIFLMARLQNNHAEWATDLMDRIGLQYRVPGVSRTETADCLSSLSDFANSENMFFSVVNTTSIEAEFIEDCLGALYGC